MTLRLMQDGVATVDDEWHSPLAERILQRWEHDPGQALYWRASANFIFFFKRAGRDCVLRFNHASERTVKAIEAEVAYLNELAARRVLVATPLRSLSGSYVESVPTAIGTCHAVVFEAVPGAQHDLDELTAEQFVRWGRALGDVHTAASTASAAIGAGRPTWEEHLALIDASLPPEEEAALQALRSLRLQLQQLPTDPQHFGLIHFDAELDNLLWQGDHPTLIDFDDCAWYWFVADIAFALRDLFNVQVAGVDLAHPSFRHFIAGYRQAWPIAPETLELLPLFVRLHNLLAFVRLHRALTPLHPDGEPAWMAALREKLVTKMRFYREGFSA
jgi:Ser/Thr protein kinase RdoA (MazF antagonist)